MYQMYRTILNDCPETILMSMNDEVFIQLHLFGQ